MRVLLPPIVLGLSFLTCGPTDHSRKVWIDPTFTPAERGSIMLALADWQSKVLIHFEEIDDTDAVEIWRVTDTDDPRCSIGPGKAGLYTGSSDKICLLVPAIENQCGRSAESAWRSVAAHEIGHALGLPHLPVPSVMATPCDVSSEEVTPRDVEAFYRVVRF